MRTTIDLDDDVQAEVDALRRQGLGVSEAVNELARSGAHYRRRRTTKPFVQKTFDLGMKVDVANIGEVLDLIEDFDREHGR